MDGYKKWLVYYGLTPNWKLWRNMPVASLSDLIEVSFDVDMNKLEKLIHKKERDRLDVDIKTFRHSTGKLLSTKLYQLTDKEFSALPKEKENLTADIARLKNLSVGLYEEINFRGKQAESAVIAGLMGEQYSGRGSYNIKTSEFVKWLKKQANISYPKELDVCVEPSLIADGKKYFIVLPETAKGITGSINTLRLMVTQFIKFSHGNDDVALSGWTEKVRYAERMLKAEEYKTLVLMFNKLARLYGGEDVKAGALLDILSAHEQTIREYLVTSKNKKRFVLEDDNLL